MIAELRAALQAAIGIVFLISMLGKVFKPLKFVRAIEEYQVLPHFLTHAFGICLIAAEAFLAASHLTGQFLPAAIRLGLCLVVCIGVAVLLNLYRGRDLPCYCFGYSSRETISYKTIVRLSLLFAAELILLFNLKPREFSWQYDGRNPNTLDEQLFHLVCAMLLILFVQWSIGLPDILALRRFMMRRSPEQPARLP